MRRPQTFLLFAVICLPIASCIQRNNLLLKPVIAGGYADTEVNEEIKKAALFAVETQLRREKKSFELLKISKVRQQVVAGMNYQFELTLKNGETHYQAAAIVFQSLKAGYELTAWHWLPTQTTR